MLVIVRRVIVRQSPELIWLQLSFWVWNEMAFLEVCQDLSVAVGKGGGIDAIIVDFYKALDVVPHDQL